MMLAMVLAHLVGDFILQTDKLAYRKSRDLGGMAVHGLIILVVTGLFALLFEPFLWTVVLFITVAHLIIDAAQLFIKPPVAPIIRFFVDQLLHFASIFVALAANSHLTGAMQRTTFDVDMQTILIFALGYAFVTMPTWVLLKFVGYALVQGSAPEFPDRFNKYAGIIERILVLTVTLAGLYFLVPVAIFAHLIVERKQLQDSSIRSLYLFESFAGAVLAFIVGLAMRAALGL